MCLLMIIGETKWALGSMHHDCHLLSLILLSFASKEESYFVIKKKDHQIDEISKAFFLIKVTNGIAKSFFNQYRDNLAKEWLDRYNF